MQPDFKNTLSLASHHFRWLFEPRLRVFWHLSFWVFFYLDMLYDLVFGLATDDYTRWTYLLQLSIDVLLVYSNNYLLIPRLLFRQKTRLYILVSLGLLVSVVSVNCFLQYDYLWTYFYHESFWTDTEGLAAKWSVYLNVFSFQASILGTGIGINIFKKFIQGQIHIKNMEVAQLQSELTYLKAQLDPHFLFNALNNIHVLTKIQPEKATVAIELLSELLRYQLYECRQKTVPLENEISYLNAYLDMERIRKHGISIDFEIKGSVQSYSIPPLLLITFVENAVKHGITPVGSGWIKIFLQTEPAFVFEVRNSLPSIPKTSTPGVGLDNLSRRLSLLYPNGHQMETRTEDGVFIARLSLHKL